MNINTFSHLNIENSTHFHSKSYARLSVYEIYNYIVAANGDPFPMFIVEWKYPAEEPHRLKDQFVREVLVFPSHNTLAWLDDLVRHKESNGCFINGILSISDVELNTYEIPQSYRDFVFGEGERPEWYDSSWE